MSYTSIRWGLALAASLLAQITLIALSFAFVAVYSYLIRTGESAEFYSAFGRASAPWVSLVVGGPVFFLIARWIRRRAPSNALGTAFAQVGFYFAIEIAALLAWPGDTSGALPFMVGGMALKAAGTWLGVGGMSGVTLANSS